MAKPDTVELGAFAAGEIPPPFTHTFVDLNGLPIDISGFTVFQMNIEIFPDTPGLALGSNPLGFQGDGTDGKVIYYWTIDDMRTPGDYQAQAWVGEVGTPFRFASDLLKYTVYDGPGEAPDLV
jgi:hypothetical protein